MYMSIALLVYANIFCESEMMKIMHLNGVCVKREM